MKRNGPTPLAMLATLALVAGFAASASATPTPNSIKVFERVFNDCPISTVNTVNNYPTSVVMTDSWNGLCVGYANLHLWDFSGDAGATSLSFGNEAHYKFKATLTLSAASGNVEGGIRLRPWWSAADGRFNAKTSNGEIAVFGGRLPFYSFTAGPHFLTYVAGTPITMEIEYDRNKLTSFSPASIVYRVTYNAVTYSSGPLNFDQGNPSEDPPHGQWGALDPAYAGGYVQVNNGSNGSGFSATWADVVFTNLDPGVPAVAPWSLVLGAAALLGTGAVILARRRRQGLMA